LNAIGRHFHPECFNCAHCGKLFGNTPFFLEDGNPYCEADWNELFTTKCFACGFPVEAGDRWVEALNHNYHSQCFNCTVCRKTLYHFTIFDLFYSFIFVSSIANKIWKVKVSIIKVAVHSAKIMHAKYPSTMNFKKISNTQASGIICNLYITNISIVTLYF